MLRISMTIDPRIGLWLSLVAAVLSFLVGASATMTDLFGADHAKTIIGVTVLLNGVINAVNAVLHAIPSQPNRFDEFPLAAKALKQESVKAQQQPQR